MSEIVMHSLSTEKVKNAITKYKPGQKHEAIAQEMKRLIDLLTEIKSIDINDSIFSKMPIVGNYFSKIKKEHIETKYSDSKALIEELTTELTKKCSGITQDDLMLDPIINSDRKSVV